MTLEDRLESLISHHNDVSEYVKELQRKQKQLHRKSQTQVVELKEARKEIQLIRSSLSYRIGNSLIKPI
mgnify:FL=1